MINLKKTLQSRRQLLVGSSSVLLAGTLAVSAKPLPATPYQTPGPFYPRNWRGDIDSDLVQLKGAEARALGQIVHITGRVLSLSGEPLPNALVEIWQCDANGNYFHPSGSGGKRPRDTAFQGRGRTRTDAKGRYAFRTIRPVPYSWRAPHIHFLVQRDGGRKLTTQMYVFGEPRNARDSILQNVGDPRLRDSLIVRLDPANGLEPGARAGTFDIVVL